MWGGKFCLFLDLHERAAFWFFCQFIFERPFGLWMGYFLDSEHYFGFNTAE
jgi:hypothetical protein